MSEDYDREEYQDEHYRSRSLDPEAVEAMIEERYRLDYVAENMDKLSDELTRLTERIRELESAPSETDAQSLVEPIRQTVDTVRKSVTEYREEIKNLKEKHPDLFYGFPAVEKSLRSEMKTLKDVLEGRLGFHEKLIYLLLLFIILAIGGPIILQVLGK